LIEITPYFSLDESELQLEFIRASGPGGQNVNKVSSAVQLRCDMLNSASLPEPVRQRLLHLARSRISEAGVLVIEAKRYRSQEQNRLDAIQRLVALLQKAAAPPKPRKKTKPTRASVEKRLEAKRRRSQSKRLRKPASFEDNY
jgi:ribosome-associated protein